MPPSGERAYSTRGGFSRYTVRVTIPSFSMDRRLSVSTFWLSPGSDLRSSLKRQGRRSRLRMMSSFHLLPMIWTAVATGHSGSSSLVSMGLFLSCVVCLIIKELRRGGSGYKKVTVRSPFCASFCSGRTAFIMTIRPRAVIPQKEERENGPVQHCRLEQHRRVGFVMRHPKALGMRHPKALGMRRSETLGMRRSQALGMRRSETLVVRRAQTREVAAPFQESEAMRLRIFPCTCCLPQADFYREVDCEALFPLSVAHHRRL